MQTQSQIIAQYCYILRMPDTSLYSAAMCYRSARIREHYNDWLGQSAQANVALFNTGNRFIETRERRENAIGKRNSGCISADTANEYFSMFVLTPPLTFTDQETYCYLTATRARWDP